MVATPASGRSNPEIVAHARELIAKGRYAEARAFVAVEISDPVYDPGYDAMRELAVHLAAAPTLVEYVDSRMSEAYLRDLAGDRAAACRQVRDLMKHLPPGPERDAVGQVLTNIS